MNTKLTEGKIFPSLLRLGLPIAGVNAMNMAYNITDMFWLGRVSSDALAATGVSGLFLWLSVGLMLIGRIGAEVGVAQARGRGDIEEAYKVSRNALYIAGILGLLYGAFLLTLRVQLVGFFNFQEVRVATYAANYIGIMAIGIPAVFISSSIDGTFLASGNSRTPFILGSSGLILNMILTPIFIFVLDLGVIGAAVSSILSQYAVFIARVIAIKFYKNRPFSQYNFIMPFSLRDDSVKQIFKLTWPICLENTLFPLLTMVTTRFEAGFGSTAVSMSRVGVQIESLSWLVGGGFGAALTAFVGQNFGAKMFDRVSAGVKYAFMTLFLWGVIVTLILWFGGGVIFSVFLPEYAPYPELASLFITYLRILAACQIFANLEFAATNAFRGKGKTLPPSIVSISSNIIRVPLALILSLTPLGLLGIWIAVSFTAGIRGLGVSVWYWLDNMKTKKLENKLN